MIKNPVNRLRFWLWVAAVFFVFLFLVRSVLLPFVLGTLIAYFLNPAVDKLQRIGATRSFSILLIIAGFFSVIVLLLVLIVPVLASQLSGLFLALPAYLISVYKQYAPDIALLLGDLPLPDMHSITASASNFSGVMLHVVTGFVVNVFSSGVALVTLFSLILITPVVVFYLLYDWHRIVAHFNDLLPRDSAPTIREQLAIIDRTLAGFVRGQLNVCLILSAYYTVLLSLLDLKFSILIGVMTGMLVIVPYVGWMVGTGIALAVAFSQFGNYVQVGEVLAVFVTGIAIEGYFLTPKLVGKKVGLHPVWIMFGMLSGGALFGLVGVLLAVPVTAVAGVLLRFALHEYRESNYYRSDSRAAR